MDKSAFAKMTLSLAYSRILTKTFKLAAFSLVVFIRVNMA